ncbi:MAG: HAMP domain-containing histidine kinase [Rhodospirillales bacterium]|nr:HAMP domain-containing histidine kinase [Rhodospirillales bacterium]
MGKRLSLPPAAAGLSARLLLLTIAFVMLAEVLIYAPSIGRFRKVYLEDRLADAHLAILALEATPDQMVGEDLESELLSHVGADMVALKKPGAGKLMLMAAHPQTIDATHDLREAGFFGLIGDAFRTMTAADGRQLRVLGPSPKDPEVLVEVVLDETPLKTAMLDFSKRILALSLFISGLTAVLVYWSLHRLLVRPMRRITESMVSFREDPEDLTRALAPSGRGDEIGVAQRELASMQEGLRSALQQKTRLAALGIAVTKINHDLKNILATARLVSDRLAGSEDPEVRRVTPTLMSAIDRAVDLCAETLRFTREKPAALEISRFELAGLVEEVGRALPGPVNGEAIWQSRLEPGVEIEGDRQQLFRVFANLGQNAIEAGATKVEITARRENGAMVVEVADNGPGLAPRARERLFQPFAGSARPGGTGLGLAIARDLLHAHGGEINLASSTEEGTRFRMTLPLAQNTGRRQS